MSSRSFEEEEEESRSLEAHAGDVAAAQMIAAREQRRRESRERAGSLVRKMAVLDRLIVAALQGGAPLAIAQANVIEFFEMRERARLAWQEGKKWP